MIILLVSLTVAFHVTLLVLQFIWGTRFVRMLKSQHILPEDNPPELPRALVLLSLRGSDPFLAQTLRALLNQSYEWFHLRLIIDSETDPVWSIVEPFLKESKDPRVQIRLLKKRLPTCSLKNSALLQETEDLDDDYQAIVQVDADAVPYEHWLRDLLTPLVNPEVGATSGLRWYAPETGTIPNFIRYYWGSAAMIQMHHCKMIWGGSMAFQRHLLETTPLRQRWANSLADDLSLSDVLKEANLKALHIPAVLANQESTSLFGCFRFIRRQMSLVWNFHSSWRLISGFVWANIISTVLAVLLVALGLRYGDSTPIWIGVSCLAIYGVGFRTLMTYIDNQVRARILEQGKTLQARPWQPALIIPATLVMYAACSLSAMLMNRVEWRGIVYRLRRDQQIEIMNDTPFNPDLLPVETSIL
ncbi:glycosyltransferase [Planctomicrobium sp. SH527]|uniref:glycosyltransferase n=1 Tax=Planctomicrobium sp. SH527 TaxID=3448123 RepID=UPI003F5C1B15